MLFLFFRPPSNVAEKVGDAYSRSSLTPPPLNAMALLKACGFLFLAFQTAMGATAKVAPHFDDKANFPSRSSPVRLILSDIDGTLMDRAHTFFEPNAAAFPLARMLGIQIALATGRFKNDVLNIIGQEKLAKMGYAGDPGIYLNGSYVVGPGGKVLRDVPLNPSTLRRALGVAEQEGVLDRAKGVAKSRLVTYTTDKTDSAEPVYKLHVEGDAETVARVRRRLEEELGNDAEFAQSHPYSFQVVPPNCDKGTALKLLSDALNVPPEEVLALGNAANDLPMFEAAGTAVVVGDGYQDAKSAADFITVNSTEGALFAVLKKIMSHELYPAAQAFVTGNQNVNN